MHARREQYIIGVPENPHRTGSQHRNHRNRRFRRRVQRRRRNLTTLYKLLD